MGQGRDDPVGTLLDRLAEREHDALVAQHRRALNGNPEGQTFLLEALREIVQSGFRARLGHERLGAEPQSPAALEQAWKQLSEQYDLLETPTPIPKRTESEAEQTALEAGQALGLAGSPVRARAWRRVGRDLVGHGALVAEVALLAPDEDAREPGSRVEAQPETTRTAVAALRPGETLEAVAVAANEAEADLMRARLREVGIPSLEERTGSNTPLLLSGGYREISVPARVAGEARRVLAPTEVETADTRPSRRVGLERVWLRRAGKTAAVWVLAPMVLTPLALVAVVAATAGLVAGAILLAIELAAVVTLIARRRRH